MAFRVRDILDRDMFVARDQTETGLRDACRDGVGVDPSKGFADRCLLPNIVNAWSKGQSRCSGPQHVENLSLCWVQIGNMQEARLLAQSHYESSEEKPADGQLDAETLARVVSLPEAASSEN